jgi:UDP-N-acetylmuramate: L-alanyl-gamma-D-glutamyl-meso-diaminopimelate ligase
MKIYFVAGCGVGVGNLAILLKKQGHSVHMSDKGAYPPMSDLLKDAGISIDIGFDPAKITKDLDMVILGGAAFIHDPNNPQVARANELGIKTISYPRGVGEFISKEENIEIVGNHAKTTTSALVAWCLKSAGEDASYFVGGSVIGFDQTIHSGESRWSVCEGDEHPSLGQEPGGKFMYHKPKHIVFTSADWDHKNIYPTLEEYLQVYRDLLGILPEDGLITACLDGANVLETLKSAGSNKINLYTVGEYKHASGETHFKKIDSGDGIVRALSTLRKDHPELLQKTGYVYFVQDVDYRWKPGATRFSVKRLSIESNATETLGYFETSLIGQIGIENSLAAIAALHGLGHSIEGIRKGIATFKGVHRKLELIRDKDYVVINDHAHSPIKIESALRAIRTKYHDSKIFAVFHVNQSGLKERNTFEQLKTAFNLASFVLIAKVMPDPKAEKPLFGKDYKDIIRSGAEEAEYLKPTNVYYTPLVTQMKSVIENNISRNDVVVIMSSGDASEFLDMAKNIRVNVQQNFGETGMQ